jgi:hypothetical protein
MIYRISVHFIVGQNRSIQWTSYQEGEFVTIWKWRAESTAEYSGLLDTYAFLLLTAFGKKLHKTRAQIRIPNRIVSSYNVVIRGKVEFRIIIRHFSSLRRESIDAWRVSWRSPVA